MAKIVANSSDYKKGFNKHYHAFRSWNRAENTNSRRLILFYCVECGLKFLVMTGAKIYKTENLRDSLKELIESHDIEKLLKKSNFSGKYSFPPFETKYGDMVTVKTYHQLCRYCVEPKTTNDYEKSQIYEEQLIRLATWIEERV
ncbi:MAG: hypothetical protein LBR56_04805 [Sporomusaceae bacterium]|nr:hypothetical protein [Sporomusaceae bacterium]